ncbi:hypothetical protein IAU60_004655 [Kwoniella sp. DSM 27419]
MIIPVKPTRPLTLPTSRFLTHSREAGEPTLVIKTTPTLVVQHNLIPVRATGSNMEKCVLVIVPVGAMIEVTAEVDPAGLAGASADEARTWAQSGLKEVIRTSATVLGLNAVRTLTPARTDIGTERTRLSLDPLISSPAYSGTLQSVVPYGAPIAYLTSLRIELSWVEPPMSSSQKSTEGRSQLEEEAEEDEDEMILMEVLEQDEGEEERTEGDTSEACFSDASSSRQQPLTSTNRSGWLQDQLRAGLTRLLQTYLIRRFPLIFDGQLIQHLKASMVPRSLTSALVRFLHVAQDHESPSSDRMNGLIRALHTKHGAALDRRISTVSNMPTRKAKRKCAGFDTHQPMPSKHRKSRKSSEDAPGGSQVDTVPLEADIRARAYIRELNERDCVQGVGEESGLVHKLGRVVENTIGQMAKHSFLARRIASGKMGYGRISFPQPDLLAAGSPRQGLTLTPSDPDSSNEMSAFDENESIQDTDETNDFFPLLDDDQDSVVESSSQRSELSDAASQGVDHERHLVVPFSPERSHHYRRFYEHMVDLDERERDTERVVEAM